MRFSVYVRVCCCMLLHFNRLSLCLIALHFLMLLVGMCFDSFAICFSVYLMLVKFPTPHYTQRFAFSFCFMLMQFGACIFFLISAVAVVQFNLWSIFAFSWRSEMYLGVGGLVFAACVCFDCRWVGLRFFMGTCLRELFHNAVSVKRFSCAVYVRPLYESTRR